MMPGPANVKFGEKPVPVPPFHQNISPAMALDRTRTSAVRSRRKAVSAKTLQHSLLPNVIYNSISQLAKKSIMLPSERGTGKQYSEKQRFYSKINDKKTKTI